jgi:hypothetical protein
VRTADAGESGQPSGNKSSSTDSLPGVVIRK